VPADAAAVAATDAEMIETVRAQHGSEKVYSMGLIKILSASCKVEAVFLWRPKIGL